MNLDDFPGDYEAKLDALQDHQERERDADAQTEAQADAVEWTPSITEQNE